MFRQNLSTAVNQPNAITLFGTNMTREGYTEVGYLVFTVVYSTESAYFIALVSLRLTKNVYPADTC